MDTITLFSLGCVICLISGCISLLSSEHGFIQGKHWLICGLGSLLICLAAIRILTSGTVAHLQLWDILPGIPVSMTMDPLSAFFILVLCIVFVPVSLFASSYYRWEKRLRIHGALFALFFLSLVGVLSADNSWLFLIVWEAMSLLSFGLVVYEHQQAHVRRAGYIYLAMTHLGTLFLTIAFLLMNSWTGSFQFSDWAVKGLSLESWQQNLIFGLVLIGFGTKAGMVPFHVWLPRAHPAAPAPVSALMSAVMVKAGLYGLLRVIWDWFGGGPLWWGAVLLAAGLITALMGVLYLVIKEDLKQLLAYSSVENMGILLMALGAAGISSALGEKALTIIAFSAVLLHVLNHAVFKSLLFLVSGSIQHGAGTVRLNQLGGLIRLMPYTAVFFLVGAAALAAVPLFNGFVGEWLLFQSLIGGALHWPVQWKGLGVISFAGLGMVGAVAAFGMVKAFGSACLAKPRTMQAAQAHESPRTMLIGMVLLAVGAVIGGLIPATIWSWVKSAIGRWFPDGLPETSLETLPVLQDWKLSYLAGNTEYPVLSLTFLAIALAAVIVFLLFVTRMMYGPSRYIRGEVWGCGHSLTERMEYTSESLTYPVMMFFQGFYRTKLLKEADGAKYIRTMKLEIHIKHLIEVYLYLPIIRSSIYLSQKVREIQNGRIQIYLAYILAALLILLFVHIL